MSIDQDKVPTPIGIIVNISSATLMMILGSLAWFIAKLVGMVSLSRARAHEAWILAGNKSLEPRLQRAEEERAELYRIVTEMKEREMTRENNFMERLRSKDLQINELIQNVRQLSMAQLEERDVFRRNPNNG